MRVDPNPVLLCPYQENGKPCENRHTEKGPYDKRVEIRKIMAQGKGHQVL